MKNIKILLLLVTLCLSSSLIAQEIEVSIHAQAGIGKSTWSNYNISPESYIKSDWSFSKKIGIGIQVKLTNHLAIQIGSDFSRLTFQDHQLLYNDIPFLVENNDTFILTTVADLGETHKVFNLGIPITVHYTFKKLSLSTGLQLTYQLTRSSSSTGRVYYEGTEELPELTTFEGTNQFYKKVDYGIMSGLSYRLFKNLSLDINYYHGLSDTLDNFSSGWKQKNRQLTTGFRFHFRVH